jgi:hypothetical protein
MRICSLITERNSEGCQKGFTNVTPDASHDTAISKWPNGKYVFSGICDAEVRYTRHAPALYGEAAATNITFQVESGSMARSAGAAVAEPL